MTTPVPATEAAVTAAAAALSQGDLVAFPTETVYGLGADATNDRAVARVYEAKGRPSFNPLIAHLDESAGAARLVRMDRCALRLAERFWPGPMTLVLPRAPDCPVSLLASAGLDTLAVRVPDHPIARALIRQAKKPIVAPSANPSGALSPTRAADVAETLGDRVQIILDGGPCRVGLESTVVDLSGERATLLRPGGLAREDIEAVIGPLALAGTDDPIKAPGQLSSHYAPRLPVRLEATAAEPNEAFLGFGRAVPKGAGATLNLSEAGDLIEAAANLFAYLRRLDRSGLERIAVMPIPRHGLGLAINDRLERAAAPR